jgi:UDP-glucose 4-epimerase
VRDYIHVNDLADAHSRGVAYLLDGGETNYFNLGSGSGFTVREMIETARRVTNKNFTALETERRAGDPHSLIASSDKAQRILHWKLTCSLEDIVSTAWNWHQHMRGTALY